MADANGHSWAGLGPRICSNCGAVEGSKEVWEPCPEDSDEDDPFNKEFFHAE